MTDVLECVPSNEERAENFANLGMPNQLWQLIKDGLDLPSQEQRKLYHESCTVAAKQITDQKEKIRLRGQGLNVLFGLTSLPDRSPQDR